MIQFQIYLAAKSVKEALAFREQLIAGGVKEDAISFPPYAPHVARCASPGGSVGGKLRETVNWQAFALPKAKMHLGELEAHWQACTGSGFRCSDKMAEKFELPFDRAERIEILCKRIHAKEIIRQDNPVAYYYANEVNGADTGKDIPPPVEDDGGDVLG